MSAQLSDIPTADALSDRALRCRACGHRFTRKCTGRQFVEGAIPCPKCKSHDLRNDLSAGCDARVTTAGTNAKAKFDGMYPYAMQRGAKRIPGLPHADGKTAYGGYVPTAGTSIMPDRKTEREYMAGRFTQGERYARE
jgi:hypothetical protein